MLPRPINPTSCNPSHHITNHHIWSKDFTYAGSSNTWQVSCITYTITSSSRTLSLHLQMHLNGLSLQIILLKKCTDLPLTSVRLPSRCIFRLSGFVYFFTWIIPSELVEESRKPTDCQDGERSWRHIEDPTIRFDRTHICRRNAIDTPGVNLRAPKKERKLHKRRFTQFSKSLQVPQTDPNLSLLESSNTKFQELSSG